MGAKTTAAPVIKLYVDDEGKLVKVEVGSIESTPSAIPMLVGRTFIMAGGVVGMVLSFSVVAGLTTQQVLDSLSVVVLVAVFALFTLIQQIFNPKREACRRYGVTTVGCCPSVLRRTLRLSSPIDSFSLMLYC